MDGNAEVKKALYVCLGNSDNHASFKWSGVYWASHKDKRSFYSSRRGWWETCSSSVATITHSLPVTQAIACLSTHHGSRTHVGACRRHFITTSWIVMVLNSNKKLVACVIGASRGIGRQVAVDLAENGYYGKPPEQDHTGVSALDAASHST